MNILNARSIWKVGGGVLIVLLWGCAISKLVLIHNKSIERDIERISEVQGNRQVWKVKNKFGFQYYVNIGSIFSKDLVPGMTHSEVDTVMRGYWFKIFDDENMREVYFYKKGLLSAIEYEVHFSSDSKLESIDEGSWTAFNPVIGFQILEVYLRLTPEAKGTLFSLWLLKWITAGYLISLVCVKNRSLKI